MSDFGSSTRPVARKNYRCLWCGEHILKKEKHYHYSGKWEGDFQDWRMHNECITACESDRSLMQDGIMEGIFKRGSTEEK